MPNHLHGIIILNVGADPCVRPDKPDEISYQGQSQGIAPTSAISLPQLIQRFKSLTTKKYIDGVNENIYPPFNKRLWQRNYHERIIRNETELNKIREYIEINPMKWDLDEENPVNI